MDPAGGSWDQGYGQQPDMYPYHNNVQSPTSMPSTPHAYSGHPKQRKVRVKAPVPDINAIREEVIKREQEWREALNFMEIRGIQIKEREQAEMKKTFKLQRDKWVLKLREKTQENNELHENVLALQTKVEQLESGQLQTVSQRERQERQVTQAESDNKKLREEIAKLKQNLTEVKSNISNLHAEKVSLQAEHDEAARKLKDRVTDLSLSERESVRLLQTAQRQLEESRRNETSLQEQLEAQREEHESAYESLQQQRRLEEREEHEGATADLHKQLKDLGTQLHEKNQSLAALRTKLSESEKEAADLKTKNFTSQAKAEDLLRQLKEAQAESSQVVENMKKSLHERTATLEQEHMKVKVELDRVEKELAEARNKEVMLQQAADRSQEEVEKTRASHKLEEAKWSRQRSELERQLGEVSNKEASVVSKLSLFHDQIKVLRTQLSEMKLEQMTQAGEFSRLIQGARSQFLKAIAGQTEQLATLTKNYKKELAARRMYFDMLQELRGNIRVFCRVRPLLGHDRGQTAITFPKGEEPGHEQQLQLVSSLKGIQSDVKTQDFDFDRVFAPNATQEEIFKDAQPLIQSVLDGYNVCIFAYGQTGSGKTFTMEGQESNPGVNTRALSELFRLREERSAEFEFTMTVSMLEIYNEKIRDLLQTQSNDPWNENTEPKIRQAAKHGIFVEGLVEWPVENHRDVVTALKKGRANRSTGVTNMNEHSSRSHMMLSVRVVAHNPEANVTYYGKLHLIDLAGSERLSKSQAEGDRLKETLSINKSLAALGNVLEALQKQTPHIPYRNSKLTYLLQDSLGGHAKTLMFVNVSPNSDDCEETNCSLTFASRVRKVELGKSVKTTTGTNANVAGGGGSAPNNTVSNAMPAPSPSATSTAGGGSSRGVVLAPGNKRPEGTPRVGGPASSSSNKPPVSGTPLRVPAGTRR